VLAHIFVWLFVFTVPWQNMIVLPGIGTISSLTGAVAIGATVLHVALRGRLRPLISFHWMMFLFFIWVFLSAFWALAKPVSVMKDMGTYVQIFVMVWVLWEGAPTRARFINLLQAYVLGAYVAAGSTIFNYVTGVGFMEHAERFAASGFDPNDLGALLALALPMAWYLSSTVPSALWRWLNRLYFVAGTVAILLTGSRGAMLTTLVALLVVPFTLTQIRRGVRIAAVMIMIATGITAVQFVPQQLFLRLSTTSSEFSEGTLNNRLRVWKAGLAEVPGRPLHGYGPAGWYPALGHRIGNVAPHSTWLAVLVEQGIVGLLLYLSILVVLWSRLKTLPIFERRAGMVLFFTLATAISPLGWQQNKAAWLVLALLGAWGHMLASSPEATAFDPAMRPSLRRPGRPAPPVSVT
jgi:O-antigen ligase